MDRADPATRDVDGAVAVLEAARVVDMPHMLPTTPTGFRARLQHGWDGDPSEIAIARDIRGRIVGVLEVGLPHWDNTHLGGVEVTVDPAARRRGLGRALFDTGVERIRSDGRRVVMAGGFDDSAAVGFLEAMGMARGLAEAERQLDLWALDPDRLDEEYAAAAANADAYELCSMPGTVPEDQIDEVVAMTAAINDAPTGDLELEDEVFTPARIRAFETAQHAHGRRLYRVVARHRQGGELAGHTMVAVEAEQPWWAWQFDTTVVPAHRGHRLGLLLKSAMLQWLARDESQVRTIDTWNAVSNTHMVRVNDVLGYQVRGHVTDWQMSV